MFLKADSPGKVGATVSGLELFFAPKASDSMARLRGTPFALFQD
jgi:hypothetical protein